MAEFFHMGGYAFFVWTSYGIAMLILVWNIVIPVMQKREHLKKIKRRLQRAQ